MQNIHEFENCTANKNSRMFLATLHQLRCWKLSWFCCVANKCKELTSFLQIYCTYTYIIGTQFPLLHFPLLRSAHPAFSTPAFSESPVFLCLSAFLAVIQRINFLHAVGQSALLTNVSVGRHSAPSSDDLVPAVSEQHNDQCDDDSNHDHDQLQVEATQIHVASCVHTVKLASRNQSLTQPEREELQSSTPHPIYLHLEISFRTDPRFRHQPLTAPVNGCSPLLSPKFSKGEHLHRALI